MLTDDGIFLPESVIIEVLSWLPVKSLLQLKRVCKTWCSIIESPNFVSKHLKNYYNNTQDGCLLAQYRSKFTELYAYFSDETLTNMQHRSLDLKDIAGIRDPEPAAINLCGPCNGIILLVESNARTYGLWNPATKEYRDLPVPETKPSLLPQLGQYDVYGFGLDPITNQYKVVIIRYFDSPVQGDSYLSQVMVHTSGTNFWRNLEDFKECYRLQPPPYYTYLNGVYYWIASSGPAFKDTVIISFHMGEETFQDIIQFPDHERTAHNCLSLYKDSSIALLSVLCWEDVVNIWVLSDGHLVKHFTLGTQLFGSVSQVGFWKNGDVILHICNQPFLEDTQQLLLCDANTLKAKDLGILGYMFLSSGVLLYKPSLVSIKSLY